MRKLLQDIGGRLQGFLDQRDDLALILNSSAAAYQNLGRVMKFLCSLEIICRTKHRPAGLNTSDSFFCVNLLTGALHSIVPNCRRWSFAWLVGAQAETAGKTACLRQMSPCHSRGTCGLLHRSPIRKSLCHDSEDRFFAAARRLVAHPVLG